MCKIVFFLVFLGLATLQTSTEAQKQDGKSTDKLCVLPPFPAYGAYTVLNNSEAVPGQSLVDAVITVSCRRGYGIVNSADGTLKVNCSNGEWSAEMPKCERFCKLDANPSIKFRCHVPGQGLKPCESFVAPGTSVTPSCSPQYYSVNDVKHMTCRNAGVWDAIAECKADCGRVTPQAELLLIGGAFAKFGELPWHAGIFDKTVNPYEQVCGGSIVSNNVVISAAHCFWSDSMKQLPAYNYAVATGKLYRGWNDERDVGAQKSDVRKILIPSRFEGSAASFQHDIAVLVLATPFIYMPYIRPVCYDFDSAFDQWQLKTDNLGKVAGWGLIASNGIPSPVLKVVNMPFVDEGACVKTIPASFREYVTGDKFCAGYINGTSVCKGDSGGGLVFANIDKSIERYYLRGIVSASPKNDDKLCNDFTYTAFTKMTKHKEFVTESITAGTPKKCSWYLFQCDDGLCVDLGSTCDGISDCADGSDESYEQCTPGATTTTELSVPKCKLPPYPSHGTYKVRNEPDARPGEASDSYVVNIICDSGYGVQTDGIINGNGTLEMYCLQGEWVPKMPQCVRVCQLEQSSRVRYMCQEPKTEEFKVCKHYNNITDGTFVMPVCSPIYYSNEGVRNMTCVFGEWDFYTDCSSECGRVIPEISQELVTEDYAKGTRLGETPWHVLIYTTYFFDDDDFGTQATHDGSLISSKVVLTSSTRFSLDTELYNYTVVAGKFFEGYDDRRDIYAQRSNVKYIKWPENNANIVLLILETPIVFNKYIKPVCLSFDNDFTKLEGTVGKVAVQGGDITEERDKKEQRTYVMEMLYSGNPEKCGASDHMTEEIKEFIDNGEKLCATFVQTSVPTFGYTGGGLVFTQTESGLPRYYLRAVLSFGSTLCLTTPYNLRCVYFHDSSLDYNNVIFTKISDHEEFIRSNL